MWTVCAVETKHSFYMSSMTVHLIERNISVALPRGFKLKRFFFFSTEK